MWSAVGIRGHTPIDGEMDLIAQLLLKIRTCAYIEWLANELIMTANKTHT